MDSNDEQLSHSTQVGQAHQSAKGSLQAPGAAGRVEECQRRGCQAAGDVQLADDFAKGSTRRQVRGIKNGLSLAREDSRWVLS